MATENTTLPPGIEVFRAGRHIDDNGNEHVFTDADIEQIAAGYNPALREAPLVVGHPAANLPAYGWTRSVHAVPADAGARLTIDSRDVEPAFAEMVRARRFPKRSACFYHPGHPANPTPGKWYLRHVGFLGAQPPAIPGLKEIQFAEAEADGAISFSEPVLPPPDQQGHALSHPSITKQEPKMDEDKQKLEAAEAEAKAAKAAQAKAEAEANAAKEKLAQFAEAQRVDRHTAHVSFAEGAVQAGKLLPCNQATTVAVLDQLSEIEPVSFSEGDATKKVSPAEFVKSLIEGATPLVQFGEFAPGKTKPAKDMTDAELDKAAKEYAAKNNVSYSKALELVSKSSC